MDPTDNGQRQTQETSHAVESSDPQDVELRGLILSLKALLEDQHRERIQQLEAFGERLVVVEAGLDRIATQTNVISEQVDRCVASAEQLSSHIGFVESVYESTRAPLDYAARRIGSLLGTTPAALPDIPLTKKSL